MRFAFLISFFCTVVFAAPTDRYLYEYARKSYRKAEKDLYPNRVYSIFEPDLDKWVLTITDEKGQLAEPREALVAGSVVAGNLIGADRGQRFELGKDGEWTQVQEKALHHFWVKGGVP
jgi:hypothetical protein